MEDSQKKPVMIGIVVVCLVSAGLIYYFTSSNESSAPTLKAGEQTWMICRDCGQAFEIDLKEFLDSIPPNLDRMLAGPPAFTCEKCGQQSAYRAMECEKCQAVFEPGSVPRDRADRCPECGYSKIEESRKKAREARSKRRSESRGR